MSNLDKPNPYGYGSGDGYGYGSGYGEGFDETTVVQPNAWSLQET